MNAVEHIVEAYFRICKRCFTIHDVKIPGGNNRQFDLLAVSLSPDQQYHVETSAMPGFWPDTAELKSLFDTKFRGTPAPRDGPRTDRTRGKTYRQRILDAYRLFGLDPEKVTRVWVTWAVRDAENLPTFLATYENETGIRVQLTSLRDDIIPELQREVATANYDDEVLRTLSLLKQREIQTQPSATGDAGKPRA
jgi:hypothetical protein